MLGELYSQNNLGMAIYDILTIVVREAEKQIEQLQKNPADKFLSTYKNERDRKYLSVRIADRLQQKKQSNVFLDTIWSRSLQITVNEDNRYEVAITGKVTYLENFARAIAIYGTGRLSPFTYQTEVHS